MWETKRQKKPGIVETNKNVRKIVTLRGKETNGGGPKKEIKEITRTPNKKTRKNLPKGDRPKTVWGHSLS